MDVAELHYASGTSAAEAVIHDAAGLAWAVNLGCVDLNPHAVRAGDLDHPDELRIDLDPTPGVEWPQILDVAAVVREVLDDHGLVGWPKTSGSRGFHIYARIAPHWPFTQVRLAAQTVAREVERRAPQLATSQWWKQERHGVFVDFNQNAKDRTMASAYSVRATPDARVSTPLLWDEVPGCRREHFTIDSVGARFAECGDPWAGMDDIRPDRWTRCCASPTNWAHPSGHPRAPSRSSRSPGPRPATRRSRRWTNGEGATLRRPRCWSLPTSWSTACAGPVPSGTGSGSICSTCPMGSVRLRKN